MYDAVIKFLSSKTKIDKKKSWPVLLHTLNRSDLDIVETIDTILHVSEK